MLADVLLSGSGKSPETMIMPPFVFRGGGLTRRQSIDPNDIEMRLATISVLQQQASASAKEQSEHGPLDTQPLSLLLPALVKGTLAIPADQHMLLLHVMKHYPLTDQHYFSHHECYLNKNVERWDFDVLKLDEISAQGVLKDVCLKLVELNDLSHHFNLSLVQLHQTFQLIQASYHSNPYHNSAHAADVVQAACCLISEPRLHNYTTPIERLAVLFAAACHDLDHPGVNQAFLLQTNHHLKSAAQNYPTPPTPADDDKQSSADDTVHSVLEIHHIRHAVAIFDQTRVFTHLSREDYVEFLKLVRDLILATDMAFQNNYMHKLKRLNAEREQLSQPARDAFMSDTDTRRFYLQIALKCADICNTCRPWTVTQKWARRVCDEFFAQGDKERSLALPVTPIFDRTKTTIEKIQLGFLGFVARPLFEQWKQQHTSELSRTLVSNIDSNITKWTMVKEERTAKEEAASIAEAEKQSDQNSQDSGVKLTDTTTTESVIDTDTNSDKPSTPPATNEVVEESQDLDTSLTEDLDDAPEPQPPSPSLLRKKRPSIPCALALGSILDQAALIVGPGSPITAEKEDEDNGNQHIQSNSEPLNGEDKSEENDDLQKDVISQNEVEKTEPEVLMDPQNVPKDVERSISQPEDAETLPVTSTTPEYLRSSSAGVVAKTPSTPQDTSATSDSLTNLEHELLEKLKINPFDVDKDELEKLSALQRDKMDRHTRRESISGAKSLHSVLQTSSIIPPENENIAEKEDRKVCGPFEDTEAASNPSLNHYAKLTSPPPYRKGTMQSVEKSIENLRSGSNMSIEKTGRYGSLNRNSETTSSYNAKNNERSLPRRTVSARADNLTPLSQISIGSYSSVQATSSVDSPVTPDFARHKIIKSRADFFNAGLPEETNSETLGASSSSNPPATTSTTPGTSTSNAPNPSQGAGPRRQSRTLTPTLRGDTCNTSTSNTSNTRGGNTRRSQSTSAAIRRQITKWFRPRNHNATQQQAGDVTQPAAGASSAAAAGKATTKKEAGSAGGPKQDSKSINTKARTAKS